MKQGSATDITAHKTEPKSHAINKDYPGQLGVEVAFKKPGMSEGRGFKAPKDDRNCSYPTGSQGRH
jgi:hypothetical protein